MKTTVSIAVAMLVAAGAATAHAEDDVSIEQPAPVAQNAVSLHMLSLVNRAVSVEYERFVLPPKFSVVGSIGLRDDAGGEYTARTIALGAEARWWIRGRAVWSRLGPGNMAGWYLSGRLDLSRISTRDDVLDESLGSTLTVAESVSVGYRFVAWGKMEITPSFGLQMRTEIDTSGRLSPWTRGAGVVGLTLGYLF